jgi:hypothetical protein
MQSKGDLAYIRHFPNLNTFSWDKAPSFQLPFWTRTIVIKGTRTIVAIPSLDSNICDLSDCCRMRQQFKRVQNHRAPIKEGRAIIACGAGKLFQCLFLLLKLEVKFFQCVAVRPNSGYLRFSKLNAKQGRR